MATEVVKVVTPFFGDIVMKRFYTEGTIWERLAAAADEYRAMIANDPESSDGLIIQPGHWYRNNNTYKWKPADQLTIDFKFFPAEEDDVDDDDLPRITKKNMHRAFLLGVKDGRNTALFTSKRPVYAGDVILREDELTENWANAIVECAWDAERAQFVPVRIRDDRTHPNNLSTAVDVWYDIHRPIALETLTGDDLILMRKLHNRVKETMLNRFLERGNTIIDIGSGRGGDLTKWFKLGLERIYALEINDDETFGYPELLRRLSEDQERFGDAMPDVDLLDFGAEKTAMIKRRINDDRIDAIVSFFSLTFFGKSKEMFTGLLKTIDIIPEGGYFLGAVMDGVRVHDLLAKTREWMSMTYDDLMHEASRHEQRAAKLMEADPFGNQQEMIEISAKVKSLRTEAERRRDDDSFTPLGPENAVDFVSKAFSIAQITPFDMADPTRNEIEISIHETSSMVTAQQEWLFNYEIFRTKMSQLGFDEITSSFIDGPDAKYLPKDAYTFSSLNRVFCFQRRPKRIVFTAPEAVGEIKNFSNPMDSKMILMGVRQKNSGFIHAALEALSSKYRSLSGTKQDRYVLRLRKSIASKLTTERFQELHDGELSKRMAYQFEQTTDSAEDAMEAAFTKFKIRLVDPEADISQVSMLELLADELDVAIYVTHPSKKGLTMSYYSSNKVQCEQILNHDTAIVIASNDGLEFFLAGRKISRTEHSFVFKRNDVMITKLYSKICK
jgi:hypothetical protein